jgi:hypothetical protein
VRTRAAMAAEDDVIGMALVFPGNAEEKTRVTSTYVSVDLSALEVEDVEDAEFASLRGEDDA